MSNGTENTKWRDALTPQYRLLHGTLVRMHPWLTRDELRRIVEQQMAVDERRAERAANPTASQPPLSFPDRRSRHTLQHMNFVRAIIDVVARHYAIRVSELIGRNRATKLVHARQIAMYLAHELTDASLVYIGRQINRDHTTVYHGFRRVEAKRADIPELPALIEAVRAALAEHEELKSEIAA
jgi:hypothetical protein